MKKTKFLLFSLLAASGLFAQSSDWFYATIDVQNAQILKTNVSDQIQILNSSNTVSAVYMSKAAAENLKNNVKVHGPGYIYRNSKADALNAIQFTPQTNFGVLDFNITEDNFVNQCISNVNEANIGNTIVTLQNYGTRFHDQPSGVQASLDIKANWENMVNTAGRNDITVEFFNHDFTDQKSVIVTIPGSESPNEIVVVGGHLDSGDNWNPYDAPGADDNASGMATLTEVLRILLANNFHPKKTVQIMGYAAEEIGLYGSADIADTYSSQNKNVLAALQLDMTNYNGSQYDIAIIDDPEYTSNDLNLFLIELMEHYNSTGQHSLSYGFTECGYACSDHVSWTENGYMASFPFEAAFGEDNPNIHSPNDTYEAMGSTAEHSAKFVKLALEFAIEIAKTQQMGTEDMNSNNFLITVNNHQLYYDLSKVSSQLNSLVIYDASARKLIQKSALNTKGSVSLDSLQSGIYIAVFKGVNGKSFTKKFLIK